jgi:hypothetical protein
LLAQTGAHGLKVTIEFSPLVPHERHARLAKVLDFLAVELTKSLRDPAARRGKVAPTPHAKV